MNARAVVRPSPSTVVAVGTPSRSSVVVFSDLAHRDVDARRVKLGVTIATLLADADVAQATWDRFRADPAKTQPAIKQRLWRALDAIESGAVVRRLEPIEILFRTVVAFLAREAGEDPSAMLAQDFTTQKPLDKRWLAASHLRRAAMWVLLMHVGGVDRPAICRLCSCSRQNVAQAIEFIEKRREEEPDFRALLDRVPGWMTGESG